MMAERSSFTEDPCQMLFLPVAISKGSTPLRCFCYALTNSTNTV